MFAPGFPSSFSRRGAARYSRFLLALLPIRLRQRLEGGIERGQEDATGELGVNYKVENEDPNDVNPSDRLQKSVTIKQNES
jgi:hypothetical protein